MYVYFILFYLPTKKQKNPKKIKKNMKLTRNYPTPGSITSLSNVGS